VNPLNPVSVSPWAVPLIVHRPELAERAKDLRW
jgi:hypothetical protein